ncbi:MAG: MBL fold metallo-hydrolase [Clostridium sp.]
MIIKRVVAGIYGANCYIIMDEKSKEALVLDPGGDVDDIEKAIDSLEAKIKYIFLTHGHIDHTSGVDELTGKTKAIVAINEKDDILIHKPTYLYGPLLDGPTDIHINHSDEFEVGSLRVKCIETPGHTPGGMSFLIGNSVFTGDTLFLSSIGRTDLEGGSQEDLLNSIKNNLLTLPKDTIVYPGHGPQSSIEREDKLNQYLK